MEKPDPRLNRLLTEYREKVLGKTCLKYAPPGYWETGFILEHNIPINLWNTFSLDEKARLMAQRYLKNMVETIDRHYEEQDNAKKRQEEKNAKKGGRASED